MTIRIVSGGQTGVDRAALDAALELGLETGGWCPQGRLAEDGPIPERYPLRESDSSEYSVRTEWNVRDSDGTLILYHTALQGGTLLTLELARQFERPYRVIQLKETSLPVSPSLIEWILDNRIHVLNVAGPRESTSPGIYDRAYNFLVRLFRRIPD